jgi:hypothetical protein
VWARQTLGLELQVITARLAETALGHGRKHRLSPWL